MEKTIVKMPQLKPDAKSSILCAWLKTSGDEVNVGDAIFEAETDKVITQVEATCNGKLCDLCFDEGDEVEVGSVVARIEV